MKQKNLVLMAVAVGCGLTAAFLTSRMSAKTPVVETVELLVAAKDLPVGTMLTKDDLPKLVKKKQVSRDAVPAKAVEAVEELADKRLTRAVRADEAFNPADLTKGGAVSIPPGMSMASLQVNVAQAVAGFVGPGSRVDVLASIRLKNQVRALPILVNMLVLAVDNQVIIPKEGSFQSVNTVSFAVDRRQALLIKLALARSCEISLLLRNPEDKDPPEDAGYDIDAVIKLLQDDKTKAEVRDDGEGVAPPPAPKPETVAVPVAVADIPAGTVLTADLFADPKAFAPKELPKDLAGDALSEFGPYLGQTFKSGLGKGQWATAGLIGPAEPKPGAKDAFTPPKEAVVKDPPKPAETSKPAPKPAARKTHEVAVHTSSGTRVLRYEEVSPGVWRQQAGTAPAARAPQPETPPADRRVD
ncbi:MAG: Flp pilus assembly protein CpaB [Gemmataceae bacterium]|nr:Flp pilus assembly protein CpaB [Gemmataceae bacterium]